MTTRCAPGWSGVARRFEAGVRHGRKASTMLNIKNPRAHQLAVEVAAAAGESLTDAVIHALEERRDRLVSKPREPLDLEKIEALLAKMRERLPPEFFEEDDPTAFLYDPETGLPA